MVEQDVWSDVAHFMWSEPLPVRRVQLSDYKESPETGVVFEIDAPARNVFSRVNISYTEGQERRSMLYKGETVGQETDLTTFLLCSERIPDSVDWRLGPAQISQSEYRAFMLNADSVLHCVCCV